MSHTVKDRTQNDQYLIRARDTIELFKGHMRQYYSGIRAAPSDKSRIALDEISPTAAIIYPIMLPDRLELLLSLPIGQSETGKILSVQKRFVVPVRAIKLTQEVRRFRNFLPRRSTRQYLRSAQMLYHWLVRPFELALTPNIDTLVFVLDSPLWSISMSALHDGERFLIEKYASAFTLEFYLSNPHRMLPENTKALIMGISESTQGFPELPYVKQEINEIKNIYDSDILLDEEFTSEKMSELLRKSPYSILHIASFGQVDSNIDQSYFLTYDDKLTMRDFARMVNSFQTDDRPIELMTLSTDSSVSSIR